MKTLILSIYKREKSEGIKDNLTILRFDNGENVEREEEKGN
jgi:hypothetical protein